MGRWMPVGLELGASLVRREVHKVANAGDTCKNHGQWLFTLPTHADRRQDRQVMFDTRHYKATDPLQGMVRW